MQCQQAHELFSDYIERNLDAALTVSVDNHLTACSNCREEMAGLRLLWGRLDSMPAVEPPTALHTNLMAALDAELAQHQVAQGSNATGKFGRQAGGGLIADLRALFQPRSLAFAAGIAILVFGGMEVAHTQSASVPSIVGILRSFVHFVTRDKEIHSPPPVATSPSPGKPQANEAPIIRAIGSKLALNPDQTGTLTVELQSDAIKSSTLATLSYSAELVEGEITAKYPETAIRSKTSGKFEETGKAIVKLAIDRPLNKAKLSLVLTLTDADPNAESRKVVMPLDLSGTH